MMEAVKNGFGLAIGMVLGLVALTAVVVIATAMVQLVGAIVRGRHKRRKTNGKTNDD